MTAMTRSVARTARKPRQCSSCDGWIRRGERYRSITASPGGDMGYIGWARFAECADCAERYGRPIEGVLAVSGVTP